MCNRDSELWELLGESLFLMGGSGKMDGWMGRVTSSLQGRARAFQVERTGRGGGAAAGGSWRWREPGMWVESQAGKASGASRGEGSVGGVEDALEVSLGKLDAAGPINSGAGQESGMGGGPF